jgi:hypothetical protein
MIACGTKYDMELIRTHTHTHTHTNTHVNGYFGKADSAKNTNTICVKREKINYFKAQVLLLLLHLPTMYLKSLL